MFLFFGPGGLVKGVGKGKRAAGGKRKRKGRTRRVYGGKERRQPKGTKNTKDK